MHTVRQQGPESLGPKLKTCFTHLLCGCFLCIAEISDTHICSNHASSYSAGLSILACRLPAEKKVRVPLLQTPPQIGNEFGGTETS